MHKAETQHYISFFMITLNIRIKSVHLIKLHSVITWIIMKMAKTFKKVSVVLLSSNFREAIQVVEEPLRQPVDDEVLVKVLFAGANATDINISAGRYFTDGKVPFDIGLEVCINEIML